MAQTDLRLFSVSLLRKNTHAMSHRQSAQTSLFDLPPTSPSPRVPTPTDTPPQPALTESDPDGTLLRCDLTPLFERLARSDFRRRFHLSPSDRAYIGQKGTDTIRRHAADFVRTRLAPARIPNDGHQTPMRGHPVFVAQHATACCCRGCFEKWHHIPAGRPLTSEEQDYAVRVLMKWILKEMQPR